MLLMVILFLCCSLPSVSPTVFYVDNQNGNDLNEGTSVGNAFSTVRKCVDTIVAPGDECRIRRGRYHENIPITGKHGTPENPIIIAGYQDERPIIDGTILLKPTWTRHKGSVFKAVIDNDIWQLFIDDVMMTNARWPNALWSDFTVFNNSYWAKSALNSTRNKMIDNGEKNLAGSGINATGAMAILNIGSFNTFVAKVQTHTPGSNSFTYKNTFGNHHFRTKLNQYFLEDKLELLDQPGEWFYDKPTKTLYVWNYDGRNPTGKVIRGKTQTYAFQISDCRNMILANMTLFATTLKAQFISSKKYIDQLEFQSINFSYPSYSRRMVGITDPPQWTQIVAGRYLTTMKTFRIFNCTFYGTDGAALQYTGINVTLQNNLFERNDWTGAMMKTAMGGLGTIVSKSIGDRFIRNTVRFNGASAGYRIGGPKSLVLLNHFHHQCWGKIQNDGSHVQVQSGGQPGAVLKQNWIHDSPKYALRFDGDPPRIGRHGTMIENVAWNIGALMVKGDYHQVYNNLAFDKYGAKGGDHQGNGCVLCVLKYVRSNPVAINNQTIVVYNAASSANGGKYKKTTWPLAGRVVKGNIIGKVRGQLVDADNWDFRPRAGSKYIPNVGPYKYDPTSNVYWIPGRQLYKTSTPIPLDTSTTVKPNRAALMWLNALGAQTHHVYLGQSLTKITEASVNDPEYKGKIQDGGNVYFLKEKLKPGSQYYWRVDAEISEQQVYRGDVWSFSTK